MFKIYLLLLFSVSSFFARSQTVDFTFANNNGSASFCNPATINFTPACTGNPIGFTWYFGNGQPSTSNSAIPSVVFTMGTYNVKLVAVFQNVALEITKTITINPSVTASLMASADYICKPDSVKFTTTTNAISPIFLYNFTDGTVAVSTNNNIVKHYFDSYGTYYPKVKVTSINGCADSADVVLKVKKFPIYANVTPAKGCAPIVANFTSSVSIPTSSSVTNYAWSFADGTAISNTTVSSTTHTYVDSGTYLPTLLITTSQGCTNTFTLPILIFGKQPSVQTAFSRKPIYCGNEYVEFVVKSDFADEYKWEFGDGDTETTTDTLATHKYTTLGVKIVKVTPYYKGCAGMSFTFTVSIIGAIARFDFANTCAAKKTFSFINLSQGNQLTFNWNFGDNSPIVNSANPIHTFPPAGAFNTILIVSDVGTGCRDTTQNIIYTANPTIVNPDTFLCKNSSTTFTLLNNYTNPSVNIYWTVLDYNYSIQQLNSFTTTATIFGDYNHHNAIINNGYQYCIDTIALNKLIVVRGPKLDYTTSNSFCTNNNFVITNTSTPYAVSDTIKNWYWTFGIPGLSDTKYQPTPFIYTAEGNYTIQLFAKDKNGCTDTLRRQILVKESPFLRIFPRSQVICSGKTITFTAYHTNNLVWAPANLFTCNTCDTTVATPTVSAPIYAVANNPNNGCTLIDSCMVTVYNPFVATNTGSIFAACKGDTVRINGIQPTNKKILWTPTTGLNNSTVFNPLINIFADTTTYTALLTDSAGCYSSSSYVKTKAYPFASVQAGPDRILSYNSPFTITPLYSPNVTSYKWSPAGNLDCTTCPYPNGLADVSQTFYINTNNQYNCPSKDTISIFVECVYANLFMASAYSPTNTGGIKYYYPQTRGISMINKFTIYNRFGEVLYDVKNALPNVRTFGWNGKYRGETQAATGYVYTLEATCELGEKITKKGSFLLIR